MASTLTSGPISGIKKYLFKALSFGSAITTAGKSLYLIPRSIEMILPNPNSYVAATSKI